MRHLLPAIMAVLLLSACADDRNETKDEEVTGVGVSDQGTVLQPVTVDTSSTNTVETHANERFRNVTVTTVGEKQFKIVGEAQVFEGTISWKIEDGHDVLQEGHETTSAGAPEWGRFEFTVTAEKQRENSTLHLILYEASAKDGSHQHELPLLLY